MRCRRVVEHNLEDFGTCDVKSHSEGGSQITYLKKSARPFGSESPAPCCLGMEKELAGGL